MSKGFIEVSKCILNAGIKNSLKELNVNDCDLSDDDIIVISQAIPYIETLNLSWNNDITSKGFNEVSKCVLNAGIKNSLKELDVRGCGHSGESLIAIRKLVELDILVEIK